LTTEGDGLANRVVAVASPAATELIPCAAHNGLISPFSSTQLHYKNEALPSPPQASCHRKLQLEDTDAHEPNSAQFPSPSNAEVSTSMGHFSSYSSPLRAPNPPAAALPSASQLAALEEAVALAAAAHERAAVTAWISSQAQVISVADAPLSPQQHEAAEQRLQEQKVWGLVNSTVLSDLMKSLGSGSIFHH